MRMTLRTSRLRRGIQAAAATAVAFAALGAAAVPAQAAPGRANVPMYRQQYADDCEATSLRMVLAYHGHHLTDWQILTQIGIDWAHPHAGYSGPTSGDPYRAFVGNPNGSESRNTGFGVYYPRIAAVATANHLNVLYSGMNLAPAQLYKDLAAGHQAVVWIDYLYRAKPSSYYRAWDGRRILYAGPAEHAIVLTGVTTNGVYVNDPARGSYWLRKSTFEAGYWTYHDMAVVIA
ncbi:uncharacterized protein YvpB [Streptacidiphilus sp. MAP12-20]|uniref:C39 family peptidase n=1 Tax=Streptacidiphilus sp. MAP12-20 TaxID=3156299 RepID=UPI003513A733